MQTWQEGHEGSELQKAVDVVLEGLVRDARDGCVGLGATEFFLRHRLTRHSLQEEKHGDR